LRVFYRRILALHELSILSKIDDLFDRRDSYRQLSRINDRQSRLSLPRIYVTKFCLQMSRRMSYRLKTFVLLLGCLVTALMMPLSPTAPEIKLIDPKMVQKVWSDFEPYRRQAGKQ